MDPRPRKSSSTSRASTRERKASEPLVSPGANSSAPLPASTAGVTTVSSLFFSPLLATNYCTRTAAGTCSHSFAPVWMANQYMSIYARLRLDIKHEGIGMKAQEQQIQERKAAPPNHTGWLSGIALRRAPLASGTPIPAPAAPAWRRETQRPPPQLQSLSLFRHHAEHPCNPRLPRETT